MRRGVCLAGRQMEGREQSCIGYMELAGVIIEVAGSPAGRASAAAPAPGAGSAAAVATVKFLLYPDLGLLLCSKTYFTKGIHYVRACVRSLRRPHAPCDF